MLALALSVVCAGGAFSAFFDYRGMTAFKQNDHAKALYDLGRQPVFEFPGADPEALYLQTQAAFKEGIQKRDVELVKLSETLARRLKALVPVFLKADLLAAHARMVRAEWGESLTNEDWKSLLSSLWEVVERQPRSPWIAYKAATLLLGQEERLSLSEVEKAWGLMSFAALQQPERYLEPSVTFAWLISKDPQRLLALAGESYDQFRLFMRTLQKKGLWGIWASAMPRYLELRRISYLKMCESAEAALALQRYEEAEQLFGKATGIDGHSFRAKAGKVLTAFELNESVPREAETVLARAMERGEISAGLQGSLKALIERMQDPYLSGHYYFMIGDFQGATEAFSGVSRDVKRIAYYRALALIRQGRLADAREILSGEVSSGKAGFSEMMLWEQLYPEDPSVQQAVQALQVHEVPAASWQSRDVKHGILTGKGEAGIVVDLAPGESSLCFMAKKGEGYDAAALMVRLSGEALGAAWVFRDHWQPFCYKAVTTGGRHWFSVQRMNDLGVPGVALGKFRMKSNTANEYGLAERRGA